MTTTEWGSWLAAHSLANSAAYLASDFYKADRDKANAMIAACNTNTPQSTADQQASREAWERMRAALGDFV